MALAKIAIIERCDEGITALENALPKIVRNAERNLNFAVMWK